MPILGVMRLTFEDEVESIRGEDDFFSVASTMPLVAVRTLVATCWHRIVLDMPLMPSDVTP